MVQGGLQAHKRFKTNDEFQKWVGKAVCLEEMIGYKEATLDTLESIRAGEGTFEDEVDEDDGNPLEVN